MARYGMTSTKNSLSWSQGSSVATVTRLLEWKIEDLRFCSHQGQENIHFSVVFRPTLGPIELLLLQHVSRSMKPTFQTYLVDKLRISYTYTLSCVFMAVCVIQCRDKVIIYMIRYFIVSVLMETLGCVASRNFSFFSHFLFKKPTDALISQIYFCQETLHVRLSIIRSLFTVHSAMVYVTQISRQLSSTTRSCLKAVTKPAWHIPVPNIQWKNHDDGQRNCPRHVEFLDKNKFRKLVRLLVLLKRNLLRCTVTWT